MKTIRGRNVNEVYYSGIELLLNEGREQSSQYDSTLGKTLEISEPVGVMYERPMERILYDAVRDSNPFLGFFEALWIIAGRKDVAFLQGIVDSMKNFSDDGRTYYGAYGYRLRVKNDDQVSIAISRLKANPDDRQVVMMIREPGDIGYCGKDQPCNYAVDLKVRNGALNITVMNRSNDFIWGLTGTNVVQFSTLQEYIAGHIGVEVGTYHQITTSMHCYQNQQWDKIKSKTSWEVDPYQNTFTQVGVQTYPMFKDSETYDWNNDLYKFFINVDNPHLDVSPPYTLYFNEVVWPMWETLQAWKSYQKNRTIQTFHDVVKAKNSIKAEDWHLAVAKWLNRRERQE